MLVISIHRRTAAWVPCRLEWSLQYSSHTKFSGRIRKGGGKAVRMARATGKEGAAPIEERHRTANAPRAVGRRKSTCSGKINLLQFDLYVQICVIACPLSMSMNVSRSFVRSYPFASLAKHYNSFNSRVGRVEGKRMWRKHKDEHTHTRALGIAAHRV